MPEPPESALPTVNPKLAALLARPERVFLLLAVPFGLALLLLTPPFQCMDEENHFARAYHCSLGRILPERQGAETGVTVPRSVFESTRPARRLYWHPEQKQDWQEFRQLWARPLAPADVVFMPIYNTVFYPPVLYLPHLPGLVVGRLLGLGPLPLLYLGRLTGFAAYLVLMFLAIRVAPLGKWVLLLLGLMPVSLFVGAGLSVDGLTNGLAFLFLALCLREALGDRSSPLSPARFWTLTGVGAGLALCKMAYVPLLLLVFLIPAARLGAGRRYGLRLGLFFAGALALFVLWTLVVIHYHARPDPNVSLAGQLQFILGHPWAYVRVVWQTLAERELFLLFSLVGALGWQDTMIGNVHFISYLFLLGFVALVDAEPTPLLTGRQRAGLAGLFLVTAAAAITAVYLNSSPVGANIVNDLTGRYFLPALPVLLVALSNRNFAAREPAWHRLGLVVYSLISLPLTCWAVYHRYYLPGN